MIRQAISCDICGAEKKQTNHWFVAWEQGGELRVSGWSSRNRLRAGSKHLCGQACMHKLADDFMARVINERGANRQQAVELEDLEPELPQSKPADSALDGVIQSSARSIAPAVQVPQVPIPPTPAPRHGVALVPMPDRPHNAALPAPQEPPRYATRNWRAEAWERERERAQQGSAQRPDPVARRVVN